MTHSRYDAVIVGAGPNGLAAAITLARAGRSVVVFEGHETPGGGTRSLELTLPGYTHDVCSAIHPMGIGSPFLRSLPLERYGLEWIQPDIPLAHPLPDGTAAVLYRDIRATGSTLGEDSGRYQKLIGPYAEHWDMLAYGLLGPLRLGFQAAHPGLSLEMAGFALVALRSARSLAEQRFLGERARALFAGMAAHTMLPLEQPMTSAAALIEAALGHAVGWPLARGGSQSIAKAMVGYLRSLGGEVVTSSPVESLGALPPARAILCDVTPGQLLRLAGDRLPEAYRQKLRRYRYGPGVFKIDYALREPVPWTAPECRRAGTVHVGGTLAEIASSERSIWRGVPPEQPFILVAQQSLFDASRAPEGRHTLWAYCHVPSCSEADMTAAIEAQLERFAPGFKDCVLARHTMGPAQMEHYNPNYVGGDINGGVQDIRQHFTRPTVSLNPYATAADGLYLCSSSTPPGGGVHGMCGYFAAQAAMRGSLRSTGSGGRESLLAPAGEQLHR
ncbi:MAG: FAD-dependent oxidoreductase [Chloroflexi bacterium]|nr:MAG: FAD-dependent oxidoreductase [Chloroflexota bacterium]